MLSIIICSISPERLQEISQNIHATIGVEHEIIAIDNREKCWSIARAYNEGARQARYPYKREHSGGDTKGASGCVHQELK